MIVVIDYGMGNLRSVEKAFSHVGEEVRLTSDPAVVEAADGIVLPGVGAFGDAMFNLKQIGMPSAIKKSVQSGVPFLGICLGMQLLFSTSEEHGTHVGLGLVPGHVRRFRGDFKIPHIGWNSLTLHQKHPLMSGVEAGDYVYFVHSYYVDPIDKNVIIADAEYHVRVPAVVGQGRLFGIQFHPEKSSDVGLKILSNFAALCREEVTS